MANSGGPHPWENLLWLETDPDRKDEPTVCFMCDGYYGSCFDEYTCPTCHSFLFPNVAPDRKRLSMFDLHGDDNDSGNDEPVEVAGDAQRQIYVTAQTFQRELNRVYMASREVNVNIEALPPEVIMVMFSYLDTLSLWCVGQVCRRWKEILDMHVPVVRWKAYFRTTWPLFHVPNTRRRYNWYEIYTKMVKSCSCLQCIRQMLEMHNPEGPQCTWRDHRLRTELRLNKTDPVDGIQAKPLDVNCYHWQATIEGPAGSPYEGGVFFLYIQIPQTYPMSPPVVRFLTRIVHPNVSRHGSVGIDCLSHNWSLALTINKVLISIQSLLTDPNCDICMEPSVAKIYLQDREYFNELAREWTWRFAMSDLFFRSV